MGSDEAGQSAAILSGIAVKSTGATFHLIDLDDREHQLGVCLPSGEAVVLDPWVNRGHLVVYMPADVAALPMDGGDP